MKKIVMALASVVVFAISACTPAVGTGANGLAGLAAGTGAGANVGGVGGTTKVTKAQFIKYFDCIVAKAGGAGANTAQIQAMYSLWSQIPDAQFEASITPQQVEAMGKAYAQLGCSLF